MLKKLLSRNSHHDVAQSFLAESQRQALECERTAEYYAALGRFHRAQIAALTTPAVNPKEALDVHK